MRAKTVELIGTMPRGTNWKGLSVDRIAGLEAGLIKTYSPPWNKRSAWV